MKMKKKKLPPFVGIGRLTMASEKWRDLSPSATKTYMHIKYHFNGHNNGKIAVSMRTLGKEAGIHFTTVKRAIKKLIEKEWVERTDFGGLPNNMNSYKLTWKYDNWAKDETKPYEAREQGNLEFQQQKKTEELKASISQNKEQ